MKCGVYASLFPCLTLLKVLIISIVSSRETAPQMILNGMLLLLLKNIISTGNRKKMKLLFFT